MHAGRTQPPARRRHNAAERAAFARAMKDPPTETRPAAPTDAPPAAPSDAPADAPTDPPAEAPTGAPLSTSPPARNVSTSAVSARALHAKSKVQGMSTVSASAPSAASAAAWPFIVVRLRVKP